MRTHKNPNRVRQFLNWRQIIPSIITLAAMLAGFLSILSVVWGFHSGSIEAVHEMNRHYLNAARLIMLAMILDGIDGNLARWLKGTSEFGAELDTYVDMTAFGIAPAILIFAVTLSPETPPLLRLLLPSAVALSGVVRLARFKVADPLRGQGGYGGLPITANAGWVALFVFISQVPPTGDFFSEDLFSLQRGWFATVFLTGILVFISLQVSNVRYPKPTKKAAIFIPSAVLVFLFVFLPKRYSIWTAVALLILGLVYAVAGPMFVKGAELHQAHRERKRAKQGAHKTKGHRRKRRRRKG